MQSTEHDGASLRTEIGLSPTAKTIMVEWLQILGTDRPFRPDDNFFEAGGDSIHVLTLVFRMRQLFGIEVSPGTVFDAPTPRLLGQQLDEHLVEDVSARK